MFVRIRTPLEIMGRALRVGDVVNVQEYEANLLLRERRAEPLDPRQPHAARRDADSAVRLEPEGLFRAAREFRYFVHSVYAGEVMRLPLSVGAELVAKGDMVRA
jgi:hypothetical protein